MAFGSIAASIGTALVGKAASSIFGGGGSQIKNPTVNINAGGLKSKGGTVTSSPFRERMVGELASTFPKQADFLRGLRASVAPGMSDLRKSRLAGLANDRSRTVGNLRDNLARRRVLGSSFAQDAIVRAEKEFGQERDRIEAESFLQELELSSALVNEEFAARRGEFQTQLDELNLQAEIATQLASGATAQLGANARLKAELDAQSAAGAGKFFGQNLYEPLKEGFDSLFSGAAA